MRRYGICEWIVFVKEIAVPRLNRSLLLMSVPRSIETFLVILQMESLDRFEAALIPIKSTAFDYENIFLEMR